MLGRRSEMIFSTCSAVARYASPGRRLPVADIGAAAVGDHLLRQIAMRGLQAVARLLQRQALVIVAGGDLLRSSRRCGRSRSGRRRRSRPSRLRRRSGRRDRRSRSRSRRAPASAAARAASPAPPGTRPAFSRCSVSRIALTRLARQKRRQRCRELVERGAIVRDDLLQAGVGSRLRVNQPRRSTSTSCTMA